MTRYGEIAATPHTQTEKAREDQAVNNAGGFVFQLDVWKRLERFLILGVDGPTYYVTQTPLVRENAAVIEECLKVDYARTIRTIVEISDAGRAPKNDPAIFALAIACASKDPAIAHAALAVMPQICRIGTHLFHWAADVNGMRGWGPALRKAVARWYCDRKVESLAHQAIKYPQRDGWSHRDLLRLSHAASKDTSRNAVFRWITQGGSPSLSLTHKHGPPITGNSLPELLLAFEELQKTDSLARVCELVHKHNLPHETVPSIWKSKKEVWEVLLESMGSTALLRNLNKMTAIGLLAPLSAATNLACSKLMDISALKRGRVHPISVLVAQKVYAMGRGLKGSLTWVPEPRILDALDAAFYLSFSAVEPTGKNFYLGLDISGSMSSPVSGSGGVLSCREAVGAMAMAIARTEKNFVAYGFTAMPGDRWTGFGMGWSKANRKSPGEGLTRIDISERHRLLEVCEKLTGLPMGPTDCSQPMLHAADAGMDVDVFMVLTDNETYAGDVHPFRAMHQYREKMGKPEAKLVVNGMTAAAFTIADPTDPGMLDVSGFDTSVPAVISDFASGSASSRNKSSSSTLWTGEDNPLSP